MVCVYFSLLFVIASCGGGGGGSTPEPPVPGPSITLSISDDQIYLGFSIIGKKKDYVKSKRIKKGNLYITGKIGSALVFAAIEKKILLIDLDPQGNLSTGIGIKEKQRKLRKNKVFQSFSCPSVPGGPAGSVRPGWSGGSLK